MEHAVEIRNLKKEYEEFLLDSISLNIPSGFVTGIIGPNGAGKTTTIKLIMNLIRADAGHIQVFGLDHAKNELELRNRIGYVGEEQYFYDLRSARWTGEFVSHFYKHWNQDKYEHFLDEFKIPPKKRIQKYSKGMKVKLSLAVALSHNPELIILDEPTSGMDPVIRRDVLDFLQSLTQKGELSVIISSHITDDLARIADYIVFIIDGRICLFASKDDLLSNRKKIHFKKDSLKKNILDSLSDVQNHMFGSSGITKNYTEIRESLSEGIQKGDIKVESLNLDDILISLVKES